MLGVVPFVVGEGRFLEIAAGAEQLAGGSERLGNLGDDPRRAQNRELRTQRREQVTPVPLSQVIGMDGDPVNEGP